METGIHGVPRGASGDVVVTVEVEGVRGEHARFVALADDTLVVEEGENLEPLAVAVEQVATIPYRADATRRSETQWAVGIRQLKVVEFADDPGGEEVTLSDHVGARRSRSTASAPSPRFPSSRRSAPRAAARTSSTRGGSTARSGRWTPPRSSR